MITDTKEQNKTDLEQFDEYFGVAYEYRDGIDGGISYDTSEGLIVNSENTVGLVLNTDELEQRFKNVVSSCQTAVESIETFENDKKRAVVVLESGRRINIQRKYINRAAQYYDVEIDEISDIIYGTAKREFPAILIEGEHDSILIAGIL